MTDTQGNMPEDWLPPLDYTDHLPRQVDHVDSGIAATEPHSSVKNKHGLARFMTGLALLAVVGPYALNRIVPPEQEPSEDSLPAGIFVPGLPLKPSPFNPSIPTPQAPKSYMLAKGDKIPASMFYRPKAGKSDKVTFESWHDGKNEDLAVVTSSKISKLLKDYTGIRSKDRDEGILVSEVDDMTYPEIDLYVVKYTHGSHIIKNINKGYKYLLNDNKELMPTPELAQQLGIRLVGKMVNSGRLHSATITVGKLHNGKGSVRPQSPTPPNYVKPPLPGNPVPLPNAQDEQFVTKA